MRRGILIGAGAAAGGLAFARLYRPWHLRWGATDTELAMTLPGDELVPAAEFDATRALTVAARPEDIWPWIVQMGYGRAGFYSYDLLDNVGRPSATELIPELQRPEQGDWVAMSGTVNDNTAFRVHSFETGRWMLWAKPGSTWLWSLRPIDERHTRLITRLKAAYRWTRPTIVTDLLLMELGDFPTMRRCLLGIRRRAEASAVAATAPSAAATEPGGAAIPREPRDRSGPRSPVPSAGRRPSSRSSRRPCS